MDPKSNPYRAFLRKIPAFKSLSDQEIDVLAGVIKEKKLEQYDNLYREGDAAKGCYILVRGSLKIYVKRMGVEETLTTLRPGAFLGHVALLDGGQQTVGCDAITESLVLYIERQEFDLLLRAASSFAFKFLDLLTRYVVKQLRESNKVLIELAKSEQRSRRPRSLNDPGVQAILKDVASRMHTSRLDEV